MNLNLIVTVTYFRFYLSKINVIVVDEWNEALEIYHPVEIYIEEENSVKRTLEAKDKRYSGYRLYFDYWSSDLENFCDQNAYNYINYESLIILKTKNFNRYKTTGLTCFDFYILAKNNKICFSVFSDNKMDVRYPIPIFISYNNFWEWVLRCDLIKNHSDFGSDNFEVRKSEYIDVYPK